MKLIQKAVIKQWNKYLIGLRSEKAKYFPLHWDFPGGKLEPDEEPFSGIEREVKEETNLDVRALAVIGVYEFDIDRSGPEDVHEFTIYSTEILGWDLALSDEHLEHRWATKEEIEKLPHEPYFELFLQEHT